MKTTIISDTHTRHHELDLPGGDLLIHAGDFMNSGYDSNDIASFAIWLSLQDYKHIILVAGNHDRMFENDPVNARKLLEAYGDGKITYLEDSSTTIDGIKFYGSPWTPFFCNWGFQLMDEQEAKDKWSEIPEDVDVLITHGPAYGHLDQVLNPVSPGKPTGIHLGDKELTRRIEEINPKVHICGHIHSSQGVLDGYGEVTTHINAACLGEDYKYSNRRNYIEFSL